MKSQFEFIELQWVQTDFLRLSDNNIFVYLHTISKSRISHDK